MVNLKFVWLSAAFCAAGALAQVAYCQQEISSNSAQASSATSVVAYVYVASTPPNGSVNEIQAYAAAPNGRLTPVPGSPFPDAVTSMAVNGLYLMGASQTTADINAYRIQSDGSLTYAASTDYAQYNNPGGTECGSAGQVFFDHTGADLYIQEFEGSDACANTVVASFALDKSSGSLNYLGTDVTGAFPGDNSAAYFIGNNVYAYNAVNSGCMYFDIYGFTRSSNGLLNSASFNHNSPTPPASFRGYIAELGAADPTNHFAFLEQPANPPGCTSDPVQLATYTVDASGNLTTTSTYADMPATLIASPYDMKMAPSGKLLAVAGQEGLQIFHFNGANPITYYTGLLTSDPINQMFWDNHNHLYAISQSSGKLYVFTVTPIGYIQAPGSPYTISSPDNIIVQPWPLPWA